MRGGVMSKTLNQITTLRKNLEALTADNVSETIDLLDALAVFADAHELDREPLLKMRQIVEQCRLAAALGWTRSQMAKAFRQLAERETQLLLSQLEMRAKRTDVRADTKRIQRKPR